MTETISQAELRNNSARVMDDLEAGKDFVITRNGRPVGELKPITKRRQAIPIEEAKRMLAPYTWNQTGAEYISEIDAYWGDDRDWGE